MISYILAIIAGVVLLVLDQYTKYIVASTMVLGGEAKTLIPSFIDLIYVKNDGGAWGMLGGYTWLLISLTAIIMLVCICLLFKYGTKNKLMFWAIILVLSGGVGNMIDRILRGGYVVDFFHFTFWDKFPVFNVADCGVCIGAGLLLLYFLIGLIAENREKHKPSAQIEMPDRTDNENI